MTSALLFVALLIVVDLSYRRWIRHSIMRGRKRRSPSGVMGLADVIDLVEIEHASEDNADATVIALPPRRGGNGRTRRSG